MQGLTPLQLRGLLRAGDVYLPGGDGFPRFSRSHVIHEVDRIVEFMAEPDRAGFRFLMTLFGVLPGFALRGLLRLADRSATHPSPLLAPLRQIHLGAKGVAMTLYYSDVVDDGHVHGLIGWDARCGPQLQLAPAQQAFVQARRGAAVLRKLPLSERLACLSELAAVILRRQEWIVDQVQAATGKSRTDALVSEVLAVLDHLAYLERFAPRVLADRKAHTPLMLMGKRSRVWFEPLGVVLVISPWNYPFYQAIVPITSALACGNAVVYKPSEHTPLTGVVEELMAGAGIPGNWVQVVNGAGAIGEELIAERPDKVFFTGSTRTGRRIMELAARHPIPVELELGGKDAMIVFEDADLARAAAGAAWGAFTNSGQSCTSVERCLVHESVLGRFESELLAQVGRLRVGVDRDGSSDLGAMTTDMQVRVVADHLDQALGAGATALTGADWDRTSRLIPPIVLRGVTAAMKVWREETFGPVLPLVPFRDEDDAVALANDGDYGLSASVWSADLGRAERVARRLVVGNVSINNVMVSEGNHALPFGGAKQSGFGRYKGEFGLYSFSNVKAVMAEGMSGKIEANWYPYTPEKYGLFQRVIAGAFGRGPGALLRFVLAGLKLESLARRLK